MATKKNSVGKAKQAPVAKKPIVKKAVKKPGPVMMIQKSTGRLFPMTSVLAENTDFVRLDTPTGQWMLNNRPPTEPTAPVEVTIETPPEEEIVFQPEDEEDEPVSEEDEEEEI